jgi:glutamate 5-kinase
MDVVSIVDAEGREFARGIANCASGEAEQFLGKKNSHRETGRSAPSSPVLVTRDNIVLMEQA